MDAVTEWLIFLIMLMMMGWGMRIHFAKKTRDHTLYFGISKVGDPIFKLLRVKNGLIELPPESGKEGKETSVLGTGGGKLFAVAELATINVGYPLGLFRFLQVPVKMVIFKEWSWEPISNRGEDPLLSPLLLRDTIYEAKSGGWAAATEAIEEQQEVIRKLTMRQQLKPILVYTGLLLVIAAIGGIYYLSQPLVEQITQNTDKIEEILDMIRQIGAGEGLW